MVQSGCAVSIFDATNTTKKRRQMVIERCKREPGVGLLFIESICQDPGILSQNYQIKLHNADYCNTDRQTALVNAQRTLTYSTNGNQR